MADELPEPGLVESADIVVSATVKAARLRFRVVPEVSVRFEGDPGEESASGSRRAGLPDRVAPGVVHRSVRIEYVLASRLEAPH